MDYGLIVLTVAHVSVRYEERVRFPFKPRFSSVMVSIRIFSPFGEIYTRAGRRFDSFLEPRFNGVTAASTNDFL